MCSSHTPSGESESRTVELTDSPQAVQYALDELIEAIRGRGYTSEVEFAVRLAAGEALANAFQHGRAGQSPVKPVTFRYEITPDRITMVVRDHGQGFDPNAVPDPTLDENLDKPCGRGLMLMRAYMTRVSHNAKGDEVTMVYER